MDGTKPERIKVSIVVFYWLCRRPRREKLRTSREQDPMWPSRKSIVRSMIGCTLLVWAASATFAATNQILTLNLAGSGPNGQIGMNGSGVLSTQDDGVAATTGDQNTSISY